MLDVKYLKEHLAACEQANNRLLWCTQTVDIDSMTTYGRKHRGLKMLNKLLTVWQSVSETLTLTREYTWVYCDDTSIFEVRYDCVRQKYYLDQTKEVILNKLNLLNSTEG